AWLCFGDSPLQYHVLNIFIQIFVVLVLYFLGIRMLTVTPRDGSIPVDKDAYLRASQVSFAATLLFAVHPFAIHSVTWISGSKDSYAALFSVLALLLYGQLLSKSSTLVEERRQMHQTMLLAGLGVLCLGIATLCKELAVVLPAFASVWYWYSIPQVGNSKPLSVLQRAPQFVLAAFWFVSLAALYLRSRVLAGIGLNVEYPAESFLANMFISTKLIVVYWLRILMPTQPTIVDRWPVAEPTGFLEFACLFALFALAVATIASIIRRKPVGLALAWLLIWMLPSTGILPLRHMYAERYLYPASWGVFFGLAILFFPKISGVTLRPKIASGNGPPQLPGPRFLWAFGVIAALFSVQTIVANRYWRSDESLFRHAVEQNPNYAEGLSALALIELERENFEASLELAEKAIQSGKDPDFRSYWSLYGTYSNAGSAALRLGKSEQALSYFREAEKTRPLNALSHYHLGLAAKALSKDSEAAEHYKRAIELDPNHNLSRNNLGHLYLVQQKFSESINLLSPVVEAEPENTVARANLATAFLLSSDFDSAAREFEKLLQRTPQDGINMAKLAWAEFELGKRREASIHLATAQKLVPNHPTIVFVFSKYVQNTQP
ncbi:MAG: tetratricopeptide repeat protein, partial [Planctomycetota bacterium]